MRSRAEAEFHREMVDGADRLKREIGYNPTRFLQMVAEHGGPDAARQLLKGNDASDGFTTLWDASRLDMSVEAAVLRPWYSSMFSDAERAAARHRLAAHGFDVDAFIRSSESHEPAWVTGASDA